MKLFTCTDHDGMYMEGTSIIIAETERKAKNLLKKAIEKTGYLKWKGDETLTEIPMDKKQVIILDNGDY